EAGEQLGGERKCLHLLEGEHAHPVERLAIRHRAGVGDVPEPHGPTLRANVTVRQKRPYAEPVTTRGIVSYGAYLPHRRLDRAEIAGVAGPGGGKGTRRVASCDEDTPTMGVEAARRALRAAPDAAPNALWFATVAPAYLDKTNATAVHAALRLDSGAIAADFGGAIRSGVAALRVALGSSETTLIVSADIRTGLPGSADEANG